MTKRNWFHVYMRPEGGGEGGSAGGAAPAATPPAGGATPPAAGATPPAGDTTPPAGGDKGTPAAGGTPADALLKDSGGGEQKANDDQGDKGAGADDGTKQGKDDKGTAKVVPEKYELQLPEGMALDEPTFNEFSAVAKEAGLTQEQAQKLGGVYTAMRQREAEDTAKVIADWDKASQSDAEIGGDNFKPNLAVMKRSLDAYATPAFKEMLGKYGLVNNPEVLRFLYRVGKDVSDDKVIRTNNASTGEKSIAKTLYPHLN